MTVLQEQQALKEISNLLPDGYIKTIPFDVVRDVSFEFNGVTVQMSALYLNEPLNCYMFDLAWGSDNKIFGIPIKGGINILRQYSTPLPNMFAANRVSPNYDVTSWRQLYLFIIDESVLESV